MEGTHHFELFFITLIQRILNKQTPLSLFKLNGILSTSWITIIRLYHSQFELHAFWGVLAGAIQATFQTYPDG